MLWYSYHAFKAHSVADFVMAKKRRKKNRKKKRFHAIQSPEELRARLEEFLEKEKFQDAVHTAKELLSQVDNEENRALLRQAYMGRINALAAKNMLKEALALLKTMTSKCGKEGSSRIALNLFIRAGKWKDAAKAFSVCSDELDKDEIYRVESFLGALLLSGADDVASLLPADSPVLTHFPAADSAVENFCLGNDQAVRKDLKGIPYRSPYRDLRTLITGILNADRPSDAKRVFSKIPDNSPYSILAQIYVILNARPDYILDVLSKGEPDLQKLLAKVLDLRPRDLNFIRGLAKASRDGLRLFRLLNTQGGCLPTSVRRQLVKYLLPHCSIDGIPIIARQRTIPADERTRLMALTAELDGVWPVAVDYWDDYLDMIKESDPRGHMKKALVLRHQADLMKRAFFDYDLGDIVSVLKESLEYDPHNVQAWLDAVRLAEQYDTRQAYRLLNDAVKQLPEETRILIAAMEAASKRNAHKKAARLAQKVLSLDPINSRARNFLISSHLSHGRKLCRQKKYHLARAEFQAAESEVRSLRYRGRSLICEGMLNILEGDMDAGIRLVEKGQELNGSPLLSAVLAVVEARMLGLKPGKRKEFEKTLQELATALPQKADVLRLSDWVISFMGEEREVLRQVLLGLKKYMSKATELDWSRDEGVLVCRMLNAIGNLVALGKLARLLRKKWLHDLEIEAWEIIGRSRHGARRLSERDLERMLDLIDELGKTGNSDLINVLQDVYDNVDFFSLHQSQDKKRESPRELMDSCLNDDDPDDSRPACKLEDSAGAGQDSQNDDEESEDVSARQLNLFE